MIKCEICGEEFKCITHKHLKHHEITVERYKELFPNSSIISEETSELLHENCGNGKHGDDNPAKKPEVRERISNTVKELWDEGKYINRINGMLGKFGELAANYKKELRDPLVFAETNYREFLQEFEDISICNMCGKPSANIHHIDEDHKNFLLTNLEPLCVPCHTSMHYSTQKKPFIEIGKEVSFAAAHRLPNYDKNGGCFKWHGHEWKLIVTIKKRINPRTGMIMDFKDLKAILQTYILDKFDHNVINDYIEIPTAENILVYIWLSLMFDAKLKGLHSIQLFESPTSSAILNKNGILSMFYSNIESFVTKEVIEEIEKSKNRD